jgi:membrane peptidoglycan carboxypeptidase
MQLAKNLFLGRDKTLARKLEEVVLTTYLEQVLDKHEILELYANTVEFGPSVYGIRAAADHYFGCEPAELTPARHMFLASLLPSPVRLHAQLAREGRLSANWRGRIEAALRLAHKRGLLSAEALADAMAEPLAPRAEASLDGAVAPMPQPRTAGRN